MIIALAARGPGCDADTLASAKASVARAAARIPECRHAIIKTWSGAGLCLAWAEPGAPVIASGRFSRDRDGGLELLVGRALGSGGPDVAATGADEGAAVRLLLGHNGDLTATVGATGAQPLYTTEAHGLVWFSNLAPLVAAQSRAEADPSVAASYLAFGFDPFGRALWSGVERLPSGRHRWSGTTHHLDGPGREGWMHGGQATVRDVAEALVDVVRCAPWPGHPLWCDITAGRDSRVILAATIAGGVQCRLRTMATAGAAGFPETEDVQIARRLAEAAGLELQIRMPVTTSAGPVPDLESLAVRTPGTVDIDIAGRLSSEVPAHPRPVILSGLGGELGRSYWRGDLDADGVLATLSTPASRALLNTEGSRLLTSSATRLADDLAGLAPARRGAGLYLRKLQAANAASLDVTRFSTHTVAPFWSTSVTPLLFALPDQLVSEDRLPRALVDELAPSLGAIPYEAAKSTSVRDHGFGRQFDRVRLQGSRLRREVGRTVEAIRRDGGLAFRPLALEALHSGISPAADLCDRSATERILRAPWYRLDSRDRRHFWRLVTLLTQPAPAVVMLPSSTTASR